MSIEREPSTASESFLNLLESFESAENLESGPSYLSANRDGVSLKISTDLSVQNKDDQRAYLVESADNEIVGIVIIYLHYNPSTFTYEATADLATHPQGGGFARPLLVACDNYLQKLAMHLGSNIKLTVDDFNHKIAKDSEERQRWHSLFGEKNTIGVRNGQKAYSNWGMQVSLENKEIQL